MADAPPTRRERITDDTSTYSTQSIICFHPNALSMVSRIATAENRGRVTSLFVVGGNIGYAIGPLLAGGVVALFGLPGLMYLVIPAVIMAVILRKVLPVP